MSSLSKRRILVGLVTLVAGLLLTGCASGYQQVDGRWVFVTWNESSGREDIPVPDVDGASFSPFGKSEYARDATRVYYRAVPIEGADATTYKHMRGGYWQDRNRVYFLAKPIPGSDPRTFRFLQHGSWARDAGNVYVGADPVNPKDLATFQLLNANWAKDAAYYYPAKYDRYLPIAELDYPSFQVLKGGWAKDRYRVYFHERVVEGADPATFTALNDQRARDNAYYYLTGFRQRTVQEEEALQQRQGK